MKICLLFMILFVIRNCYINSSTIRNANIVGSEISFKLRDKIYETIREIEINLFHKRKDNKKIMDLIKDAILIIIENNKKDWNQKDIHDNEDKNSDFCKRNNESDFMNCNWPNENLSNYFENFKNLVEFVSKLILNVHEFIEGIIPGLYSDSLKENFCLKNESEIALFKEEFFEDFKGLMVSLVDGENFVFILNGIYEKLKKLEMRVHDSCRIRELRKKILNLDTPFGSTLTSFRILERSKEIFFFLKEVFLSFEYFDFKRLGYSFGKIISIIIDFN